MDERQPKRCGNTPTNQGRTQQKIKEGLKKNFPFLFFLFLSSFSPPLLPYPFPIFFLSFNHQGIWEKLASAEVEFGALVRIIFPFFFPNLFPFSISFPLSLSLPFSRTLSPSSSLSFPSINFPYSSSKIQLVDLGSTVSSPAGSGAKLQPKLNLVHFK